jgi:hypothetical protein
LPSDSALRNHSDALRRSRLARMNPASSARTRRAPRKARHRQHRPRLHRLSNQVRRRNRPHCCDRRHRVSKRRPSGRHRQAKCLRQDCQAPLPLAPRLCGRSTASGRRRADRRRNRILCGRFRLRCRREPRHRNYGKCSHHLSQHRRSDKCSPRLRSRRHHNDRCNHLSHRNRGKFTGGPCATSSGGPRASTASQEATAETR